ncbi:MAG: NAD(P)H-dependent oxidoreductase [Megasphaera sp.]|jgi:flavodoxin|nr:NAD(P)H-dependent oxidoreductase [Megasphaera sp.]MCI1247388.1 NAD(P)H-dependent oxidoreductase [Megasphaera sp.]
MLIAYYSWSNGNTKAIAEQLQRATGADMARIDTVTPYRGEYNDVVSQGQDEVQRGYEPAIQELAHNPAEYDIIAVGTPTWWYTMAPAVTSFFSNYDLAGKTVIPFMTNGGWPGHVINDMIKASKSASHSCGKEIRFDSTGGSRIETPQQDVDAWIDAVRKLL